MNEDFTKEELDVLKEIAKDRLALSRWGRKVKNIALTAGALVAAYVLIVENVISWIKIKLGS